MKLQAPLPSHSSHHFRDAWGRHRRPAAALCLVGLGACLTLTGCRSTPDPERKPPPQPVQADSLKRVPSAGFDGSLLHEPTNAFTLGPGDRLEIEIIGDPATRAATTVGPDGKIYFYLLPGLDVWGHTLTETKAMLEEGLNTYFRERQQVAVTLRTVASRRVWVLGRLNEPGVYPLESPTRLLEALARAGGIASASAFLALEGGGGLGIGDAAEEAADLKRSFVIRDGRMLPVDFQRLLRRGDASQNIYLQAGDLVYLPSALSEYVHVLGAVAAPRAVSYQPKLTVVQAVARAGGTIRHAYLSHVAILRGSLTQPSISVLDFKAVVRGEAPDVLLEAEDIVYVPFSPYRTLYRYADIILQTFVRTVAVNEGARLVDPDASPVSVNVPVGGGGAPAGVTVPVTTD